MSEAERLFTNYETMQKEMTLLCHQLENFVGITEDEMIDTMVFGGRSDEPRVTMTKRHDRTETIALSFREKIESKTWDDVVEICHISRSSISYWKKKAIRELDIIYQLKQKQLEDYLLS